MRWGRQPCPGFTTTIMGRLRRALSVGVATEPTLCLAGSLARLPGAGHQDPDDKPRLVAPACLAHRRPSRPASGLGFLLCEMGRLVGTPEVETGGQGSGNLALRLGVAGTSSETPGSSGVTLGKAREAGQGPETPAAPSSGPSSFRGRSKGCRWRRWVYPADVLVPGANGEGSLGSEGPPQSVNRPVRESSPQPRRQAIRLHLQSGKRAQRGCGPGQRSHSA